MKSLLKIVVYGALSLAVLYAIVVWFGSRLPLNHSVSRSVTVAGSQAEVWERLTNPVLLPVWRGDVKRVTLGPQSNCYTEFHTGMKVPMCILVIKRGSEWMQTIVDPKLPFQGVWTYDLQSVDAKNTRVTIREDGSVRSPFFRYISYQVGLDHTIAQYEEDLMNFYKYRAPIPEAH